MINMLFSLYNFNESWAKKTVEKYIDAEDRVLVIPFSFGDEVKKNEDYQKQYNAKNGIYYKEVVKPFYSFGIKEKNIHWLNYFKDSKKTMKAEIKEADIIFFTGGYPDKMKKRLKKFDLTYTLENFTGLIMGSSAGAMIQIENYHITPDSDYSDFSYHQGLKMIDSFDVEVHYEESKVETHYIKKALEEKMLPIYAIGDQGGLIVDKDKVILLGDIKLFEQK